MYAISRQFLKNKIFKSNGHFEVNSTENIIRLATFYYTIWKWTTL